MIIDKLLNRIIHYQKVPSPYEIKEMCSKVKEILIHESNVLELSPPISVVGDVHGQFYDLLEMFKVAGSLPNVNYLFLGDYVDRGHFSLLTITLLLLYKIKYPNRIHLLRGNHETRSTAQVYGFYKECESLYSQPQSHQVFNYFMETFDYLSISALIGGKIFAVHGGLSPSIVSIDQIRVLERFHEVQSEGPIGDLLWSDPDPEKMGFTRSNRGAGYHFGQDILEKFLHVNNCNHLTRAHQLCLEGYQLLFDGKLSTCWSAPNYCYRCGNHASVLQIDDNLEKFFLVYGPAPDHERKVREETIENYFV